MDIEEIEIKDLPPAVAALGVHIIAAQTADGTTSGLTLAQVSDLVIARLTDSAPAALDAWLELVAQIEDNEDGIAALVAALALKAPIASPALTGTPTAPTAAPGTNTTQLATTAFVAAAVAPSAIASFSPTITGFGTVPSTSLFWKMLDGLMYIEGTFVSGTPQTGPAVQARVNLPSGYQVDPTSVPTIRHFGTAGRGAANSAVYLMLGTGGQTYLTFGRGDVSNNPLSSTTGDLVAASGNTVSINAIVPVTAV